MTPAEVYKVLSGVNVAPYVQKKGGLDYLPWADCHRLLLEFVGPYVLDQHTPVYHQDGSASVSCTINIHGWVQSEQLPVMDYKNNAVQAPDARDLNDNQKRCFVKCAALFGLGLSLYTKEVAPEKRDNSDKYIAMNAVAREHFKDLYQFRECIQRYLDDSDLTALQWAIETYYDAGEPFQKLLSVAPSKGGFLETAEKAVLKSNEWNATRKEVFANESA